MARITIIGYGEVGKIFANALPIQGHPVFGMTNAWRSHSTRQPSKPMRHNKGF